MRVLIAVVNAHTRLAYQQCIRDTWLPLVQGADVKFFLGPSERLPKDDEVFLECDDSYEGLPSKVRGIMRWASDHDYDYAVKLDDDVIIRPEQFLNSGFHSHDFTGHKNDTRQYPVPFGFSYWLSNRAMKLVADANLPNDGNDEVWVTKTLSKAGIVLNHEPRYVMYVGQRENFVPSKVRALRAPKRPQPYFTEPISVDRAIAWVMYFNWAGFHMVSDDRIVAEMRKVFNLYVAS